MASLYTPTPGVPYGMGNFNPQPPPQTSAAGPIVGWNFTCNDGTVLESANPQAACIPHGGIKGTLQPVLAGGAPQGSPIQASSLPTGGIGGYAASSAPFPSPVVLPVDLIKTQGGGTIGAGTPANPAPTGAQTASALASSVASPATVVPGTVASPSTGIMAWIQANPLLSLGGAAAVLFLIVGGKHERR